MLVLRFLRQKLAQAIREERHCDVGMYERRIRAICHGRRPD
jgi:hypothetical protein